MVKTTPFDAAEYLTTPGAQAEFVAAALETGDADYVRHAVGVVARARGMTEIAKSAGLNRESLYKALGNGGNTAFGTMVGVLKALGLELTARVAERKPKRTARKRLRKAA